MIWDSKNSEDFFASIEKLTDEDQYTECINMLESIPSEERDYRVRYQLARAYQNFAIIGDADEGTPSFIGNKALLKSIELLNSIKEQGQDKAGWNMRMAYGYQYLINEEEKAIPYALRWAELDPLDENALEVVKECKEEIEKRKQRIQEVFDQDVLQETVEISEDWGIYLCRSYACNLPAVVRVNLALSNFALNTHYSERLQLQVLCKHSDAAGFPKMEEAVYLNQIEDAMLELIKKHGDILAGVVKCNECMYIVAYAKNGTEYTTEVAEIMAKNFPDYVYTFATSEDKNWDMYFYALYPDKYELQSIWNRNLIESIKRDGDSMGPRILEHCLFFKTTEQRQEVLVKVMEAGFRKLLLGSDDDSEASATTYRYQLIVGREDSFEDIDEVVWDLMDLAEEYDGYYDGWGCNIVR